MWHYQDRYRYMFIPPACIDTLFDYVNLLESNQIILPENFRQKNVAIVGAGAAGLCAGYELLKLGIVPTIFEASDRIGGRIYTKPFSFEGLDNKPFSELGAMRIPMSSLLFNYYANTLGLTLEHFFPDIHKSHALIYFENKAYQWQCYSPLPEPFNQIDYHWRSFINPIVEDIHSSWQKGDLKRVIEKWQIYIDKFKNKSLFDVLSESIPVFNKYLLIKYFGAIGFGMGGLSSLYYINFLEILRVFVNAYNSNHYFMSNGMSEFTELFYTKKNQNGQSLQSIDSIKLNTVVLSLDYDTEKRKPFIAYRNELTKEVTKKMFDAVIYTGTTCAAHLLNFTIPSPSGIYIFNTEVRNAIRNSNMIAASKLFICTKDKFWQKNNMPQCILTDELPRSMYFLDYPNISEGIICLSYSWGMDSMRLHAVDPSDRVIIIRRIIEKINPNISQHLYPLMDEVISIDWFNIKYQNGAFKLLPPGYDKHQKYLYFQYKTCLTDDDKGIYLAGDSISWSGGWVEGALYTAINSVYAVCKRFDAKFSSPNPLEQQENLFSY